VAIALDSRLIRAMLCDARTPVQSGDIAHAAQVENVALKFQREFAFVP